MSIDPVESEYETEHGNGNIITEQVHKACDWMSRWELRETIWGEHVRYYNDDE